VTAGAMLLEERRRVGAGTLATVKEKAAGKIA
jgi:hypothetical protein